MSTEFDFVGNGLAESQKGVEATKEILSLFGRFKGEIKKACLDQFKVEVDFEPANLYEQYLFGSHAMMGRRSAIFPRFGWKQQEAHEVSNVVHTIDVYVPMKDGVRILKYEMHPITGYPVNVIYASKNVECSSRNELLATIQDAYNLSVRAIRTLCTNN